MAEKEKKWLENPAVVIDHGATRCTVGMAGEKFPRAVLPTVVGRPKESVAARIPDLKNFYIGSEAELKGDKILLLRHPLYKGMIDNWDDMAKIWDCIYSKHLRINPEDHPVLLTEAPLVPIINREKMCQVMFETFNPPAMYIAIHQVLFLYATGQLDGLVLDSGHDVTYAVPIYKGYSISKAITRLNFGGRDLTYILAKSLASKSGDNCVRRQSKYGSTSGDAKSNLWEEVARNVKERYCYVAADFQAEMKKLQAESQDSRSNVSKKITQTYELPDGKTVNIEAERFMIPEGLFQPSMINEPDSLGFHQAVHESIQKIKDHNNSNTNIQEISQLQKSMYNNIYLCGRNCLFPGLKERLKNEIQKCASNSMGSVSVRVKHAPEGSNPNGPVPSAWVGGSILASLPTFQNMWISRQQYDEWGPSIVHQKCVQGTPDGESSTALEY
ncbi:hypothetical protein J437_LFUL013850 [Ladona fulva]|uniref:Uncharacterized protein n=1 Tax=Ladona fulva TaxID=123851 RepID=A0A8K0P744_LADFU|nr:hypothetical protein J437_LFUL013850 [Ladona fulva]